MSPKKSGLSINTGAANRSSDERVFEADGSEPGSEKPGKKSAKKVKAKKSQTSLKQFKDDDPQMRALEHSFLNASRPASPPAQVINPVLHYNNRAPNRAPNREALNRNLSVLSYDTDASHGSGMSNETIKPSSYQRDASGRTTGRIRPPNRDLRHARSNNALCLEKNLGEAYFNGQGHYHPNTLSTLYIDEHLHPPAYGRIARKPLATANPNPLPLRTPESGSGESGNSPDTSVAYLKRPSEIEPPQPSPTSTYSNDDMVIPRKPVLDPVASYPYFHTIVANSRFNVAARKAKESKAKESFASTSTTMSMNTDSFRSSTGNNHESFTSQSSVDSQEAERRAEERRQAERQREAQVAFSAQMIHILRETTDTVKTYRSNLRWHNEPRFNHPNHRRQWDDRNLWCLSGCAGRCSICKKTVCCEYYRFMEVLGLEARLSTSSLPEEKRRVSKEKRRGVDNEERLNAVRCIKRIRQFMHIGDDEPTFMQCQDCKTKGICPGCCGRCASELCLSVICKRCKPNPWTACDKQCLKYWQTTLKNQAGEI